MSRQEDILQLLEQGDSPRSGSSLAEHFGVTRQIIVKDIALLKAQGHNILSTPKGYTLQKKVVFGCERLVTVRHGREEIADELETIVDLGGRALTTCVEHPAYGHLEEALNVGSRKDIRSFLSRIQKSAPLLALTGGVHQHRIWAPSEDRLDEICAALGQKGYLISQ